MSFWKVKSLKEMTPGEWESLCDRCARCCLIQLEDQDTGERKVTQVVCQYLDMGKCHCSVYQNRSEYVPACVTLTPENLSEVYWLPPTCAYRLVSEGKDLPEWHPLVSGSTKTIEKAGITVKGKVLPETVVSDDDLEDHVIRWIEL